MGSIAYADITQAPAPLPSAKLQILAPGLSLQPPLTRLGTGPGLILLTTPEIYDEQVAQRDDAPTAVLKWAEEGYAVFQVSIPAVGSSDIATVFVKALHALKHCETCQPKDKVGLVCESSLSQLRLLDGC
jgi:carboxymethylenebutenolidase